MLRFVKASIQFSSPSTKVLLGYMLYPYDLDYIIENKKVVKKVLDEIWKICMRLGQEAKSPPKIW